MILVDPESESTFYLERLSSDLFRCLPVILDHEVEMITLEVLLEVCSPLRRLNFADMLTWMVKTCGILARVFFEHVVLLMPQWSASDTLSVPIVLFGVNKRPHRPYVGKCANS